jgi:hypothetical protein
MKMTIKIFIIIIIVIIHHSPQMINRDLQSLRYRASEGGQAVGPPPGA